MNMTKGGEGQRSTWKHNAERVKNHINRFTGSNNPFYGQTHTGETKKIIADKASKRNKERGITIPKWGAEKGILKVIKPVIVYNEKGVFVSEFISLTKCSHSLNISLGSVKDSLKFNSWIEGKYQIRHKTENYPLVITVSEMTLRTVARPVLCFIGSNMVEYPKAEIAANDLGIPKTTISRAANYNNLKPIRTGHVFIYKDLYEKLKLVS